MRRRSCNCFGHTIITMTEPHDHHHRNPQASENLPSSSSSSSKATPEVSKYSGQKPHYPNPPETTIPDPATLREQWRFAIKQYSRWYSHAWGTAILAGLSFFALGWVVKGSNPLPSKSDGPPSHSDHDKLKPAD